MEGVGARLGRSSTRYGPATVFSGPVRKWKKRWVHVSPSNSQSHRIHSSINASSNGTNASHLLLYKWTPLSQSTANDDASQLPEEPPRRKFKYFPVYLLEKQIYGAGDETKPSDTEQTTVEQNSKGGGLDEKPDINDTLMEQSQDDDQVVRQDLNESTLDLSLGLKSHDDDSDAKPEHSKDGQLEKVDSKGAGI